MVIEIYNYCIFMNCRTIITILFLIGFFFTNNAQNCQLTYEQQDLINQAKNSIFEANNSPSVKSYIDLIKNCSKALESVPLYPDIYYFYEEIIKTNISFSKDKNNPKELYYYEQAINYCNKYLRILTDEEKIEACRRILKELNENYRKRKDEQIMIEDDNAFKYAKKHHSIESYRAYINAFPDGLNTSEAKRILNELVMFIKNKEDNFYYEYVERLNKKDYYLDYLIRFPNGLNVDRVRKKLKIIDEAELWPKIAQSNDIVVLENYLKEFPDGVHINDIKQILFEQYIKKGDSEVSIGAHNIGLNLYYKAKIYFVSNELNEKIQREEEIILFEKIKNQKLIEDCTLYLNTYPDGEFRKEVSLIACPIYFVKARENEGRRIWNIAIDIYSKIQQITYSTDEKKEAATRISIINRKKKWEETKVKISIWNVGCDESRFFYSYILNQPTVEGAVNMNGISAYSLKNNGFGKYLSFRASNSFFSSKQDSIIFENNRFSFQYEDEAKISSDLLSFGLTKKIFRPIFLFTGIGFGSNLSSKRYTVTDTKTNEVNKYWLNNERERSWYLNPELGIMIGDIPKLKWLSFFGSIGFPIALSNKNLFNYYNSAFSCGIGISFDDIINKPISNVYLAYNFDIPNPSNLDFASNSSLFGFSIGCLGIQNTNHGMYVSIRANKLFFQQNATKNSNKKDDDRKRHSLLSESENISPTEYNNLENGNLFATIGYSVRVFMPVSIYLGGGFAWQKQLNNDVDSHEYNNIVEKIKFNPEIGINYSISHFLLRGGINAPNFETMSNNLYYSLGIGYIW